MFVRKQAPEQQTIHMLNYLFFFNYTTQTPAMCASKQKSAVNCLQSPVSVVNVRNIQEGRILVLVFFFFFLHSSSVAFFPSRPDITVMAEWA